MSVKGVSGSIPDQDSRGFNFSGGASVDDVDVQAAQIIFRPLAPLSESLRRDE